MLTGSRDKVLNLAEHMQRRGEVIKYQCLSLPLRESSFTGLGRDVDIDML